MGVVLAVNAQQSVIAMSQSMSYQPDHDPLQRPDQRSLVVVRRPVHIRFRVGLGRFLESPGPLRRGASGPEASRSMTALRFVSAPTSPATAASRVSSAGVSGSRPVCSIRCNLSSWGQAIGEGVHPLLCGRTAGRSQWRPAGSARSRPGRHVPWRVKLGSGSQLGRRDPSVGGWGTRRSAPRAV